MQMRLNSKQSITIVRRHKFELDRAIEDLINRGFTLLQRGTHEGSFDFNSIQKEKYWARLQVK